ncbi:4Fe-4S binding protein [Roseateles sp. SL47]|nr:4Fe-4S binding protein [Roseateles sp. SL47]
MTYVVTEPCIHCRYTDCVAVCPMECFLDAGGMLVIDPNGCIECAMCVPECPVDAIVHLNELSPDQSVFASINALRSQAADAKPVRQKEAAHPDHASWSKVAIKRHLLKALPTDSDR